MTKAILIGAVIFFSASARAQIGKDVVKLGVLGGIAAPATNASAFAGADIAYQHLLNEHFGVGIATGYQLHFGRNNTVKSVNLVNNDFGVVPVAALLRYYPTGRGLYVGSDVGYGFITGNKYVVSSPSGQKTERAAGGFYLKPEIGYNMHNWSFFAHYSKVFNGDDGTITIGSKTQKYETGVLGVGIAYNIGLGRR
ncbi:MAG: hypothetical protein QM640_15410 [Niabella sp.]